MRYHLNKIPCNVALVKDDLSVDIWRSQNAHEKIAETKPVYSLSKFVSLSDCHSMQDIEQSIISCKSYPHSLASSDSSGTIKSYSMHSYANSSLHSRSSSKHERSGQDPFLKFLIFTKHFMCTIYNMLSTFIPLQYYKKFVGEISKI